MYRVIIMDIGGTTRNIEVSNKYTKREKYFTQTYVSKKFHWRSKFITLIKDR